MRIRIGGRESSSAESVLWSEQDDLADDGRTWEVMVQSGRGASVGLSHFPASSPSPSLLPHQRDERNGRSDRRTLKNELLHVETFQTRRGMAAARPPASPSISPAAEEQSEQRIGRGRVHRWAAQSNCDSAEVPCIISLTWLPGERERAAASSGS